MKIYLVSTFHKGLSSLGQLEGGHKLLLLLGQTAEGTSHALLLDPACGG